MGATLHLGEVITGAPHVAARPFTLPLDAAIQTFAIMGIRRSGKTSTACVLAEEMCRANLPWIALDPVGVWWGLRANRDGKAGGHPVVVFGGQHADLPLHKNAGAQVAEALVNEAVWAVIDLSQESKRFWHTFVTDFCLRLMDLNPAVPRHLFIEEAPEFCLTPDTEIFTKSGWKKYDEIHEGDPVVAFDLDRETYEYEPIQRVVVREHRGELIRMQSRSLDCLMTPDHRAVIRRFQHDPARYRLYPWSFCDGDRLPGNFQVPSGGAPFGAGIAGLSCDLLRAIGWVITDGYYHHAKKSKNLGLEQSAATVKMGRRIRDEMDTTLTRIGSKSKWERPARSGVNPQGQEFVASPSTCFYLGGPLSARINEWLGDNLHRIPRILLENCSEPQIRALYEGLLEGDGTARDGKWRFFYPGLDEGLADDFQEIATRLGVRTVKSFVKQNGQWRVSIAPSKHHWVRRLDERVPYAGTVWCVTVKSGAFVARRNGRVFVTGNCPQRTKVELTARCKEAVERLVRLGGNRGYGCSLISQRSATVDKDVLSQCANLFVLRTVGSHDRKALKEWIAGKFTSEEAVAWDDLPALPSGTGWFWSPEWLKLMEKVAIRERQTFHPGATRHIGGVAPRAAEMADVGTFVAKLGRQFAAIQAKEAKPPDLSVTATPKKLQADWRITKGTPDGGEVVVQDDIRVRELEQSVAQLRREMLAARAEAAEANRRMAAVRKALEPQYAALRGLFEEIGAPADGGADRAVYEPWLVKAGRGGARRRMLDVMIERREATRSQLATLAGISPRSGPFRSHLSWLKVNGLVDVEGGTVRLKAV